MASGIRVYKSSLLRLASALVCVALLLPRTAEAVRPEDFGFATIPALGERPLLTILVDFRDASFPEGLQAPVYYQNLLFATERGQAIGSVAGRGGFFDENSLGQFRFTNQGVFGPFRAVDNLFTGQDESSLSCGGVPGVVWPENTPGISLFPLCSGIGWTARNAILSAAAAGFDFAAFDANRDGFIDTATELTILLVIAAPGNACGQNRPINGLRSCVRVREDPSLDVCSNVAKVDSDTGVATIGHELTHMLGVNSWEGYGRFGADENPGYTLMGSTCGVRRDLHAWHLDPFVKIKFGWINPRIINANSSECLVLRAIEDQNLSLPSPLIVLHDLERGPNEFFLLEYRRARQANYDGDPWNTGSIGMSQDRGLAVWAMRTDQATNPLLVPSQDGATNCGDDQKQRCLDSAIHIYPPPAGLPRVGSPSPLNRGLWTPADGGAALSWAQSDGSPSPVFLNAAAALDGGSSIAVELNGGSCRTEEFRDRIQQSFWDVPTGIFSYDRRFLDDVPVPLVVHTWIHPRFRLERTVQQFVPPGDPVQVQWAITPTGTEPTLVRVRIMDDTPPGFIFNSDASELIFNEVRLNDGQTRTMSYELTPSSDIQGEGNFPVLSQVFFESPTDGSPVDAPVELESFVAVFDPDAPRQASPPPHLELALVDAKVEVKGNEFEVKATFSLDANSDGIDPLTQEVSFTVGTFATSIPAGSFKSKKVGKGTGKLAEYTFKGIIDGVSLEVKLTQLEVNRFEFKAEGKGTAVSGLTTPDIVSLTIGDDSGNTVTAKVED